MIDSNRLQHEAASPVSTALVEPGPPLLALPSRALDFPAQVETVDADAPDVQMIPIESIRVLNPRSRNRKKYR